MNDSRKEVKYFIDQDLLGAEFMNFHPNLNDATIEITPADFQKFIESLDRELVAIEIPVL